MAARLPDTNTLKGLGFNPNKIEKNHNEKPCTFDRVDAIKRLLRKNDRQQFVQRYIWDNLPGDLTGEYIERVLYYRYSGIFFYMKDLNKFNFLPFVGSGLDEKGRFRKTIPLPFNGASKDDKIWIPGLEFKPIYDIASETDPFVTLNSEGEKMTIDPFTEGCVILESYTKGLTQKEIPERELTEPILDMMAEAFPMARTKLIASSGTTGMRVSTSDDASNVAAANISLEMAALTGKRFIPVVGMTEFQEFANGNGNDVEAFMRYMTELDNLRLQSLGLKNNGLFEKKSYVNSDMSQNSQVNPGQIYQDGLSLRQNFCDIINATWGLGMSCSANETITNFDVNMDGELLDNDDGQSSAETQTQGGEEE